MSQNRHYGVGADRRARTQSPRRGLLPAVVFPLLFLVLSTVTILIYRGGHATEFLGTAYTFAAHLRGDDAGRLRYSFLLNFVSDLGRVKTYHGGSNLVSASLFCLTLGSAGLGFFLSFRRLAIAGLPRGAEARLLGPTRILGQVCGLAFAGIGWAPVDGPTPSFAMHMLLVFIAFGTVMAVCVLMIILMTSSGRRPWSCVIAYGVLFTALALFMGIIAWWALARSIAAYLALTIGQKIVVYLLVGTMLVQGIGSTRLESARTRQRGARGQGTAAVHRMAGKRRA